MSYAKDLRVKPGARVDLGKMDPAEAHGLRKGTAVEKTLVENTRRLGELQYLLYAEGKRSLLVVLQAMDAGGKDGTIRHVFVGRESPGLPRDVVQGAVG